MKLPISFDQVSYFNNEYRGDLIITTGVLYYFPHTRTSAARHADEIGGKDAMTFFDLLGIFAPAFAAVSWLRFLADKSIKTGKFLKRNFRPTINLPEIRKLHLWNGVDDNEVLQNRLDKYIEKIKHESLKFDADSVPKPMRFALDEIKNLNLNLKLKFDARFDSHDFRINPLHRKQFRRALQEGGFLK